jgi:hypothetical protein
VASVLHEPAADRRVTEIGPEIEIEDEIETFIYQETRDVRDKRQDRITDICITQITASLFKEREQHTHTHTHNKIHHKYNFLH